MNLVSVIIPCFNNELTIGRTLKSVLEQSFDNLEVIVVNDGSSDGSLDIVNKLLSRDFHVHIYMCLYTLPGIW